VPFISTDHPWRSLHFLVFGYCWLVACTVCRPATKQFDYWGAIGAVYCAGFTSKSLFKISWESQYCVFIACLLAVMCRSLLNQLPAPLGMALPCAALAGWTLAGH